MADEIRDYFQKYGEVESIHLRSSPYSNSRFGFVKFKDAADAAAALSKKRHQIGSCVVRVKAANSWHQPDGSESSEGSYDSPDPYCYDSDCYGSDWS